MGEVTTFLEGGGKTPSRPRPTNPVYDGTGLTPRYAVVCNMSTREPALVPRPPASHPRASQLGPPAPVPILSRTRSAHHRRQVLPPQRPGTPLLLPIDATRGGRQRVLGATPTSLYGAAPVPRPPLPAPEAQDGVHAFVRTQEVTAITGVHLVRLLPATPEDSPGPRALRPSPEWELWCGVWAEWLARLPAQCQLMATGP